MPFSFGNFGLGEAALGLGLGQDIFSGISNYEQSRRQRQLYDQAQQQMNPQYVLANSQPYVQAQMAALQKQLPAFMRQTINPMLGSQGIDPTSGAGQSIYANAIAPMTLQAQNTGIDQYMNSLRQAMGYGTQNTGTTYGSGGGLMRMLPAYMQMQANRQTQPQSQPTGTATQSSPYGPYASGYQYDPSGLTQGPSNVPASGGYNPFDPTMNAEMMSYP